MKIDGRPNKALRCRARRKFILIHYELFELLNKWALTPSWQFFVRDKDQNPETIWLINEVAKLARDTFVFSHTTNDKDIVWSLFCLWRNHTKDKIEDPISKFYEI